MLPEYERLGSPVPESASQERSRHAEERTGRTLQSARTMLDALILAGIIWIVSSQLDSRDRIAKLQLDSSGQSATIITQIANIQASIADVPTLRDRLAHEETSQLDLLRRVDSLEARHVREDMLRRK